MITLAGTIAFAGVERNRSLTSVYFRSKREGKKKKKKKKKRKKKKKKKKSRKFQFHFLFQKIITHYNVSFMVVKFCLGVK